MARNRTHLPELAPGCTVDGDTASFDRFVLRLDRVPVAWTRATAERAIARAPQRQGLRRGRQAGSVEIGYHGLMIGGRITFHDLPSNTATLELRLNLTAFLARNFSRLTTPEALRELDQGTRRNYLTQADERHRALDDNSNFITDTQTRTGRRLDHASWLRPYIDLVLAFLADELNSYEAEIVSPPPPHLTFPLRNWSFRQLEVFWEFWSADAVGLAADLCRLVPVITQEHRLTRYTLSEERSGPVIGISARTSHRHVVHKLYAKLRNRLRLEIGYEHSVRRIERRLSHRGPTDWFDVEPVVREIAWLAAERANDWLVVLSEVRASTFDGQRGYSSISGFLTALAEAFPSPEAHRLVWIHLLLHGSIPRRAFDLDIADGTLRLVRTGFLAPNRPGRARMNTTYRPADAYAGILLALRGAYTPTIRTTTD